MSLADTIIELSAAATEISRDLFWETGHFYVRVMWSPACWSQYLKAAAKLSECGVSPLFSNKALCRLAEFCSKLSGWHKPEEWTLDALTLSILSAPCIRPEVKFHQNETCSTPQANACWTSIPHCVLGPASHIERLEVASLIIEVKYINYTHRNYEKAKLIRLRNSALLECIF